MEMQMKRYKKSRYIVFAQGADDKYYSYNTNTGAVISVDNALKENYMNLLNHPDDIGEEGKALLLEAGMILPYDVDEIQQIQYKALKRNYEQTDYLELTILPTEQCNFRCIYCYEKYENKRMSLDIQKAIVRYVEKHIKNRKGLSVSWFGGEPLLAMPVIENLSRAFMEICGKWNKPYIASITTNGYLLDLKTFQSLLKYKVYHYQITLDGPAVIHDAQRPLAGGGKTYSVILNNLKSIKEHARGNLWTVSLRSNVTQPMVCYMKEYLDEIYMLFGSDKRFSLMIRKMWSNGTEEAEQILVDDTSFEKVMKSNPKYLQMANVDYEFTHDLKYVCYAAKPFTLVIGSDGMLYKCTVALEKPVGKIDENGAFCMDEAELAKWLVPKPEKMSNCYQCSFYAACGGNYCPLKTDAQECRTVVDSFVIPNIEMFSKCARVYKDISSFIQ